MARTRKRPLELDPANTSPPKKQQRRNSNSRTTTTTRTDDRPTTPQQAAPKTSSSPIQPKAPPPTESRAASKLRAELGFIDRKPTAATSQRVPREQGGTRGKAEKVPRELRCRGEGSEGSDLEDEFMRDHFGAGAPVGRPRRLVRKGESARRRRRKEGAGVGTAAGAGLIDDSVEEEEGDGSMHRALPFEKRDPVVEEEEEKKKKKKDREVELATERIVECDGSVDFKAAGELVREEEEEEEESDEMPPYINGKLVPRVSGRGRVVRGVGRKVGRKWRGHRNGR